MDGLELLALAYHWPPSVGREMDLDEYREWCRRAEAVLKARGGP
ncbi:MAG: hypothetical protein KatS3mg124_1831 [Porticoccaceae bacterium]|nr:MAG: hypothetical protein KatS3mg124_1831 [Porticoccaceae bacterium]